MRASHGSINGPAAGPPLYSRSGTSARTRLTDSGDRGAYASISDSEGPQGYNMERLYSDTEQTDDEEGGRMDEFGETLTTRDRDKALRTGRQRKKLAARTKGGEFQARRKKRRVYFCCVSSDIDVQKLFDHLVTTDAMSGIGNESKEVGGTVKGTYHARNWKYQLYPGGDVLHLFRPGFDLLDGVPALQGSGMLGSSEHWGASSSGRGASPASQGNSRFGMERRTSIESADGDADALPPRTVHPSAPTSAGDNPFRISSVGAQEVFIFDFGAAVFWGFSKGEEGQLLKLVRRFVTKGLVDQHEFASGEDDMAFTTSPDMDAANGHFNLTNDFITLPDDSNVKDRLSISFAIGQSAVLAIFEARIERKIEEYKYIPEALAACGKVHLSEQQLGIMIGEVFVIRHDVNLHTEILDVPNFFWKENVMEQDYKMVMDYLEMPGRTEILNKRLDMMRELLDVLQQQMESNHALNLEWIVIWLIVVEVVLQAIPIIFTVIS